MGNAMVWIMFLSLAALTLTRKRERVTACERDTSDWHLDGCGLIAQGVLVPLTQTALVFTLLKLIAPPLRGVWHASPLTGFALNFVVVDYFYYWNHRLLHTRRLWPAHAVHRTPANIDVFITSRNTLWTPLLIVYMWANGVLIFVLHDAAAFIFAAALTASLDLWRHTTFAPRPGSLAHRALRPWLITPHEHQWHHSRDRADATSDARHVLQPREKAAPLRHGGNTGLQAQVALPVHARIMTLLGRLMSFYPTLLLCLVIGDALWFGLRPSPWQPLALLVVLYLLPPLTFRLYRRVFPPAQRLENLSAKRYSPWWGAHQTQLIYTAVPQLGALLRVVPGLYSAWLRLWGSRVGRRVYWPPNVEVTDRHLLRIGDDVLMGHKCKFLGHAIKPKAGAMTLYTHTITVGNNVFVGAGSRIGPGAVVPDNSYLPVLTDVHINQTYNQANHGEAEPHA